MTDSPRPYDTDIEFQSISQAEAYYSCRSCGAPHTEVRLEQLRMRREVNEIFLDTDEGAPGAGPTLDFDLVSSNREDDYGIVADWYNCTACGESWGFQQYDIDPEDVMQ